MKTSPQGIQLIKNFESFSATAFPDGKTSSGKQLFSIGYGHQIQPHESYLMSSTISHQKALELLASDLKKFEAHTLKLLKGKTVAPNQFDALVSYTYNTGFTSLGLFSNIVSAAPKAVVWNFWVQHWITVGNVFSAGLQKRRWIEADVFFNGYNQDNINGANAKGYNGAPPTYQTSSISPPKTYTQTSTTLAPIAIALMGGVAVAVAAYIFIRETTENSV